MDSLEDHTLHGRRRCSSTTSGLLWAWVKTTASTVPSRQNEKANDGRVEAVRG